MPDNTTKQPQDKIQIRKLIDALVHQHSIAPAGYRQGLGIARHLDVDMLHSYIIQAEARNVTGLYTIIRDMIGGGGHVTAVYSQRKLSVLADGWKIEPADRSDKAAVWIADQIEQDMKAKLPMFYSAFVHLLGGSMWPAAVVGKVYKPSAKPGWNYEIDDLYHIPPVAFDYASDPAGRLMLYPADNNGNILAGQSVAPDPSQFIVHRATLLTEVPEYFGGILRAVLFWYLFGTMSRDWWARFLNRFGSPFLEGTYDPNDPSSQFDLEQAMQVAQELFGVVIPEGTMMKVHQANSVQGGQAYSDFHAVSNAEISKIILGQTLSADAQNIGFGGGQATVQNEVRGEIKAFDAVMLAATIQQNYFMQLCRYNGWPADRCPSLVFGSVSNADLTALANLIKELGMGGLRPTQDALQDLALKFGFGIERKPEPQPGAFTGLPFSADRAVSPETGGPSAEPRRNTANRDRTIQLAEQAQAANRKLADSLKDKLAAAMGAQGDAILGMLQSSRSRAEFLTRLANAELVVNPEAIAILEDAMNAGAANGIVASQPRIGKG